jgi:hypothetical protein
MTLTSTPKGELLAAILGARISEPDRVSRVLNELRVESTGHLGRLDVEEWSEMMAEMRRGGVALGSRNKLRLLIVTRMNGAGASSGGLAACSGFRQDESSSRTRQQDDSTSTRNQESTNKPEGTMFGVSSDSAQCFLLTRAAFAAKGTQSAPCC